MRPARCPRSVLVAAAALTGLTGAAPSDGQWRYRPDLSLNQVRTGLGRVSGLTRDGVVTGMVELHHGVLPVPEDPVVDLAADSRSQCLLGASGRVLCFEYEREPASYSPPGRYTAVTVGFRYGCGVLRDGTISCWGGTVDMPGDPPRGRFRAIDAGAHFVCAVRDLSQPGVTGGVECWGGMYGLSLRLGRDGDYLEVSADEGRVCALRTDGAAECWSVEHGDEPVRPGPYQKVVTTATCLGTNRSHYTCGLLVDGRLDCWDGGEVYSRTPPPEGRFIDVDVAYELACAVRDDHQAGCWEHSPVVPMTHQVPSVRIGDPGWDLLPHCILERGSPH